MAESADAQVIKIEFSSWELLKQGWSVTWDNAGLAIGGFFLYWIIMLVAGSIPFGSLIVGGPLSLGLAMLFLNMARGRGGDLGDLFRGFNQFGLTLGAYLLRVLIIVAGLILFIVPGVIWALQYFYTMYTIVDGEKTSLGALRASKRITKGNLLSLFLFSLFFGVFNILGMALCFVGVLVTGPVSIMAMALLYNKFAEAHQMIPEVGEPAPGQVVSTPPAAPPEVAEYTASPAPPEVSPQPPPSGIPEAEPSAEDESKK